MTTMYRIGTVNVTGGDNVIVGVGTKWLTDAVPVALGDWFTLDMKTWYEVIAIDTDLSITLDRNYEGVDATGVNYGIGRLTSATDIQQVAGQIATQFAQKQLFLDELRKWLSSSNATETLTDSHGDSYQVTTPQQMEAEHAERVGEVDTLLNGIKANRQVNFEQQRQSNRLKYPVSGDLEVDTSLTDVNLGISTPATTPNVFILGATTRVIDGVIVHIPQTNIKNPPAPDGLDKLDKSGRYTDIAAAIVAGGNGLTASSIDRQRITVIRSKTIPIVDKVYPNGFMQYQDSTFNGVTLIDNADQTECAMYADNWATDVVTLGKVGDWANLSVIEKDAFINTDPNIRPNAAGTGLEQTVFQAFTYQTATVYSRDTPTATIMVAEGFTAVDGDAGLYTKDGWNITPVAIVDVLNQGAYHPVYNGDGTRSFTNDYGNQVTSALWYNIYGTTKPYLTSKSAMFEPDVVLAASGYIGSLLRNPYDLDYDAVYDWQVDDRRADASKQFNQVSLLAYGKKIGINGYASSRSVERQICIGIISEINTSSAGTYVDNGEFRFSKPSGTATWSSFRPAILGSLDILGVILVDRATGDLYTFMTWVNPYHLGIRKWNGTAWVSLSSGSDIDGKSFLAIPFDARTVDKDLLSDTSSLFYCGTSGGAYGYDFLGSDYMLGGIDSVGYNLLHSASESTYTTDIIAAPDVFLATFPDGCYGRWIPVIPDGTYKDYKATRKVIDALGRVYTQDNGATYFASSAWDTSFESTDNGINTNVPASEFVFMNYKFTPNCTVPSPQKRVDYTDREVFATNSALIEHGVTLLQSMTGEVATNTITPFMAQGINLTSYYLNRPTLGTFIDASGYEPTHDTISLYGADSPAGKMLPYLHIPENALVDCIYWLFKEMKHNVTWGDNDKFIIVDGVAYTEDENGETIKVACHKQTLGKTIYIPPTIANT